MKTNILSLSFRQVAATDKSPAHLVGELHVDGARLGEGYVLDIRRLAEALTSDGEHFIFTCGCGDAGCAGIHEGVQSRISGDQVSLAGSLPKGGDFSAVLSISQARKAVAEALVSIEPVAKALAGEEGYPIGPEGLDGEGVAAAIAVVSAG
jgi:hypothetical protein